LQSTWCSCACKD